MPGKAVGRVAAGLPWLCPNTNSLICLAEAPAGLARPFAAGPDVGLLAFLLRHTPLTAAPPSPLFSEQALTAAVLPETAAAYLSETAVGWVDSASAAATACRPFATLGAAFARRLAAHTNRGCPERAAVLVALAPLGWLAVAAADALAADAVLNDPDVSPTAAVQAAAWGFDQNAITRRLAHRWRLPDWAATALGSFALSLGAVRLVASDVSLFVLAQFAVLETERRTRTLGLTESADRAELLRELRITDPTVEELWQASGADAEARPTAVPTLDQNPRAAPLLANLLRLAGESRRRNGAALVLRLEDRMDSLHAAVKRAAADAEIRARDAKLTALAELAAGAGHEINNPLAIISGHAQRLARTEP
ncbi:MAG: HDOD domain-containing protein, partial [Gemmata sp.]